MQHIYKGKDGIWYFDEYFKYLELIRSKLPENLIELICNPNRYTLTNPHSFHDAWLRGLTVLETDVNSVISVTLLGQMHDRLFELTYSGIYSYNIAANLSLSKSKKHGDLLVHEFNISDIGIQHEMLFSTNVLINIHCNSLTFNEKFI